MYGNVKCGSNGYFNVYSKWYNFCCGIDDEIWFIGYCVSVVVVYVFIGYYKFNCWKRCVFLIIESKGLNN